MQIPEAWLLLVNVMVVLVLVPVKDHFIDPLLLRCKLLPSALQKMALGMFFGFTSIIAAGVWYIMFIQTFKTHSIRECMSLGVMVHTYNPWHSGRSRPTWAT